MFFKKIKFFDEVRDISILSLVSYEAPYEDSVLYSDPLDFPDRDSFSEGQLLEFLDEEEDA